MGCSFGDLLVLSFPIILIICGDLKPGSTYLTEVLVDTTDHIGVPHFSFYFQL